MTIGATVDWEIRQDGDDLNGGGYARDAGTTDYSQQAAAQLSLTDLACASNTTLTSATGGFTAAMVGNVIQIASGTNALAGFYRITAYTDTNTVTIHTTCATGGNMTDGVGKVGGALATIGKAGGVPWSSGNNWYIKYSATAYVISDGSANVANGTFATTAAAASTGQVITGYDTDRSLNNTDTNRPTIEIAASGVTSVTMVNLSNYYWILRNVILDGKGKTAIRGASGGLITAFYRVSVNNCTNVGINGSGQTTYFQCTADTCNIGFVDGKLLGCLAEDCTGNGFQLVCQATSCLSKGNGGVGFSLQGNGSLANCVAYGNTGDGFDLITSYFGYAVNCIAEANGGIGFDKAERLGNIMVNCATCKNTGGSYDAGQQFDCIQVAGNVSVFEDAEGDDFRLDDTENEGMLLRNAGYPGDFFSLGTGYHDIGLLRHQDPAGGGGGGGFVQGTSGQFGVREA